jgi:hypothetical protein
MCGWVAWVSEEDPDDEPSGHRVGTSPMDRIAEGELNEDSKEHHEH